MTERASYESTKKPGGLFTRNRFFQVLALSAALTACDNSKQTESLQAQDAGLQTKEVLQDAQVDATTEATDAEADKESADTACKLPPLNPELQKLAESHKVRVGYHDEDGKVIYKELTLDEITGKNSMLYSCESGSDEMLWSFIKHTRNQPQLQLEAIKRMTLSKSDLAIYIVTTEGMKEYRKKTIIVMGPPPIQ